MANLTVSGVYNGLRHYRIHIVKPILNFLRFGKYQIFLKYDGQHPMCGQCNLPGHFVSSCTNKVCFNCENVGHESCNCPAPPLSCLCKEDGHMGINCRFSWVSPTVHGVHTDENLPVCVDKSEDECSHASFKTRSGDSFAWDEDLDISDDDNFSNENLPLIAAVPEKPPVQRLLPAWLHSTPITCFSEPIAGSSFVSAATNIASTNIDSLPATADVEQSPAPSTPDIDPSPAPATTDLEPSLVSATPDIEPSPSHSADPEPSPPASSVLDFTRFF